MSVHPMPHVVKATSLVQRVREQLEDDILEGRLAPGEQLDIEEIQTRFDVSRTPVREALQQLEASGLVNVLSKRGTFVAELSLPLLFQMFEVMAELEASCARLAAQRVDEPVLNALEAALKQCEREATQGSSNSYYHANEQFHQLIYQASGNAFLQQQTVALKNRLKPYRRLQLQMRNRIEQSHQEHRVLLDAIRQGDEDVAARASRSHVLVQGRRFTDLMSLMQRQARQSGT